LQAAAPAQARRFRHATSSLIIAPWLNGGPVALRLVRVTPCLVSGTHSYCQSVGSLNIKFNVCVDVSIEICMIAVQKLLAALQLWNLQVSNLPNAHQMATDSSSLQQRLCNVFYHPLFICLQEIVFSYK